MVYPVPSLSHSIRSLLLKPRILGVYHKSTFEVGEVVGFQSLLWFSFEKVLDPRRDEK